MRQMIHLFTIVLLVTGPVAGCSAADDQVPAEHADDHEHLEAQPPGSADEVPLYDNLGEYHRSIDTDLELAQAYFDQGLRLQYAFNHAEAIRSYREAVRLDPTCAMWTRRPAPKPGRRSRPPGSWLPTDRRQSRR